MKYNHHLSFLPHPKSHRFSGFSPKSPHLAALLRPALFLLALIPLASCTDVWDRHYDPDGLQTASQRTLWEELSARPELSSFCQILRQTGCDRLLDSDQMFTVFAPQGDIPTTSASAAEQTDEIIYNHVARFAVSANNRLSTPLSLLMLNGKRCNFAYGSDGYTFANQPLVETNILARNGILHILSAPVPFFCNVWEYMAKDTAYSCIRDYLYSFNELLLDEEASVPGAIVDGRITYVDSVTVNTNEMFQSLGRLNDEDSTYYMVLPTNEAWRKAYDKVSRYFLYSSKTPGRDSLQRQGTQQAMVGDLVFSRTVQTAPYDSLLSTQKHVFHAPFSTLLAGYASLDEGIECSNGRVFPVDTLRYHPWESWHTLLQVEAENTRGREYTTCELYKRSLSAASPYYRRVSAASYVEAAPTSASANPTLTFSIPDVLSASYDIKVVFLPQSLGIDKSNADLPNKLICNISTVDELGKAVAAKSDYIYTDPHVVDTVTLFRGYTFPTCNYGETSVTTKLKIQSQVLSKERTTYSRTLLVDCILLEPSKD